ncbi:MAG: bifunctional DNA primase/polymerase [Ekhidna sp.]
MTSQPFADNAEKYWGLGLDIVPGKPLTKQPAIKNWQAYLTNQPNISNRQEWQRKYSNYNICLLTGGELLSDYQLVVLDVDDDKLVPFVRSVLSEPRCAKRGKKGISYFCLVLKSENIKSTTLAGGQGLGNIDVLAGGRCTVVPPSLHPDTGKPYEWVGASITEIDHNLLPVINKRFMKFLATVVSSDHSSTVISGKATNDASLALSAQLVGAGMDDEEIMRAFRGLLPLDYSGDTMQQLPGMIEGARKKGFDTKPERSKKQSVVTLEFLKEAGYQLFRDQKGESFIKFKPVDKSANAYPVKSSATESWISYLYYSQTNDPLSVRSLKEVISTLDAEARFNSPEKEVYVRIGFHNDKIFIDRGSEDGSNNFIKITKSGWDVIGDTDFLFWRPEGLAEFPIPKPGGSIDDLRKILNFSDANYKLLIAYLINCYNPYGPFMALIPQGGKGSGKSMVSSVLKRIIDPSVVERSMLPKNEHDLVIQATQQFLLSIDNVSNVPFNLSDNFCRILTGGAFVTRRYYTDNEARIFTLKRPIILNGIGNFVNAADLLERSIQINLEPIPQGMRKTERQMDAQLKELLPGFLGALFDCISYGLDNVDKIEAPTNIRMADAAHFILACEPATGFKPGSMLSAINDAQHQMMTDRIVNDSLFIQLCKVMSVLDNHSFEGTVGELYERLQTKADFGVSRQWKSASVLSQHITRKMDMLRESGLIVKLGERKNNGRIVRITVTPELMQTFSKDEF